MNTNDANALIAAALAGIDAICVPPLLAQPYTENESLIPALQEFMPRDTWLYLQAAPSQQRGLTQVAGTG
jgi:DNA-binding transcriptional LysR family regulator